MVLVDDLTSAAEAAQIALLIAALKRCATQNRSFSATSELVPNPRVSKPCGSRL